VARRNARRLRHVRYRGDCCGCTAHQRKSQSGSPQHWDGFRHALRTLLHSWHSRSSIPVKFVSSPAPHSTLSKSAMQDCSRTAWRNTFLLFMLFTIHVDEQQRRCRSITPMIRVVPDNLNEKAGNGGSVVTHSAALRSRRNASRRRARLAFAWPRRYSGQRTGPSIMCRNGHQIGSTQIGSTQVGSTQVDSVQSTQSRSPHFRSAQCGTATVCRCERRSRYGRSSWTFHLV
jgi:hypothetical protein